MSSPICVKALLDWTTIFYFWKWCHSVFHHFASAFIFKTNLKLRYPRLVTNLIHRFAISSFLKRAKPAVQREYQLFNIETITVLPWIEKIQLQCKSSRIGESNRLPPILGLDDIKCVELVGSLHYFAPRGFSAHVPRHCPLFSKRRFKQLQIPNTAIRFIRSFQNSPVNFYVRWGAFRKRSSLALTFYIFIFFWKTMWYPQGNFLLFFQKSCAQTHVQKCHHVIWCRKQNVHWS